MVLKLFYDFEYSLTKNDPTKEVVQRINTVLDINRKIDGPNYCYLADYYNGGVSAIGRIIKKFPELEQYVFEYEEEIGDEKYKYLVLSNYPKDHSFFTGDTVVKGKNKDNISFEVLSEIAEGIPRKFPLNKAMFLFDQINWSQDINANDDKVFNMNSILYINNWWTPKRDISLFANVSLTHPSSKSNSLQLLSEENKYSLSLLGKIKKKSLKCKLNQEEKISVKKLENKCDELIPSFGKNMARNNPFLFPYDLSEKGEGIYNLPRKQTISKVIKKLGYKHLPKEGFHGVIVFGKITEHNHRILLEFDSGSTFYNLRCNLIIQGPYWKHRIDELPCTPNSYGDFFEIPDLETLEQVVENFCVVIQYLENSIIKDIETLYGPAPKWFNYEG